MSNIENNLVSIIIPSFNNCNYLKELIKCIKRQDYVYWEALVVDDGSSDGTIQMLESEINLEPRIKFFLRDRLPKGAQTCRNIGIGQAKGKYICFFDSDDLISSFCLSQRVEYMEKNSSLDFAIFPAIGFNKLPYDRNDVAYGFGCDDDFANFLGRTLPFVVWNNIYRRESIEVKNLYWDENLKSLQDSDFNIQALINKTTYKYSHGKIDYYYRIANNQNSISKKILSSEHVKSHSYYINKLINSLPNQMRGKYKNELISYILFFWNVSIQNKANELRISILNNEWVKSQKMIYLKLFILQKTSSYNIKLFSKISWILFPIAKLKDCNRRKQWCENVNKYSSTY